MKTLVYRVLLVVFVLIEVSIFSVCLHGWPPLVYVLRDTGFYTSLCTNDSFSNFQGDNDTAFHGLNYPELGCAAQQEALNLVYTVASVSQVLITVLGYIYDHCGTWFVRGICMCMCLSGTLLMAFAKPGLEWLLFPGAIAQYLGGVMYLCTDMQMPNLFPKSKTTLGIVISGATDMSTSSFLYIKLAYDAGIPYQSSMLVFACIGFVVSSITTILLPPRDHEENDQDSESNARALMAKCRSLSLRSFGCVLDQSESDLPQKKNGIQVLNLDSENEINEDVHPTTPVLPPSSLTRPEKSDANPTEGSAEEVSDKDVGNEVDLTADTEVEVKMPLSPQTQHSSESPPPISSILKTPLFWVSEVWFVCNVFLVVIYFGSFNSIIDYLAHGDQNTVSHYTNVLAGIQLTTSIPMAAAGGYIVDRQRNKALGGPAQPKFFIIPFFITSITGLSLWALCAVPVLEVQYLVMVLHSLLRTFSYGVQIAFTAYAFPPEHFGKVYSIQLSIQTVFTSLQYPLFYWLKSYLNSKPLYFSFVNVGIACLTFCLPIYLLKTGKGNQEKKTTDH